MKMRWRIRKVSKRFGRIGGKKYKTDHLYMNSLEFHFLLLLFSFFFLSSWPWKNMKW